MEQNNGSPDPWIYKTRSQFKMDDASNLQQICTESPRRVYSRYHDRLQRSIGFQRALEPLLGVRYLRVKQAIGMSWWIWNLLFIMILCLFPHKSTGKFGTYDVVSTRAAVLFLCNKRIKNETISQFFRIP